MYAKKRITLLILVLLFLPLIVTNPAKAQAPIEGSDIKGEIHIKLIGEYAELPWDDAKIMKKNIHMFHPNGNEFIVWGRVRWEHGISTDAKPYDILHGHYASGVKGKYQELQIGAVSWYGYYPQTVEVPYDEVLYEGLKEAILAEDADLLIERIGWFINGVPKPTPTSTVTPTQTLTSTPVPTSTATVTATLEPTSTNTPKPTVTNTKIFKPTDTPVPVLIDESTEPTSGLPKWLEKLGIQVPFIRWFLGVLGLAMILIVIVLFTKPGHNQYNK